MTDEPDPLNLEDFPPTEADQRLNAVWATIRSVQLTLAALELLPDDELLYIAGHQTWEEVASDYLHLGTRDFAEAFAKGAQQKVRGNAYRAAYELARRTGEKQQAAMDASTAAVKASNDHMDTTARATVAMATDTARMADTARRSSRWSFVAALAALVAAVVAVVALTRDEAPPSVTVEPQIEIEQPEVEAPDVTVIIEAPTTASPD